MQRKWKYCPCITFQHNCHSYVETFVPTLNQFENPYRIELRRLQEEPLSHNQFEVILRIKLLTTEELLHGSKQRKIWGSQIRTVCWMLQNFPIVSLHFFRKWTRYMRSCGRMFSSSSRMCWFVKLRLSRIARRSVVSVTQ